MFTTPKKRTVTDWSHTPHRSSGVLNLNPRIGDRSMEKGKAIATANVTTSPASPYNERITPRLHSASLMRKFDGGIDTEAMDWQKFKEEGLLDPSFMENQDRQALVQKISKLENELHAYQHTMGLLLIEKAKLASTYEALRQALSESQEILKREQLAHSMEMSEIEKQNENLKKALEDEKQCMANYASDLHYIWAESEDVKSTSDKKMAEAHDLVSSVEDKSLAMKAKLHASDAKHAELGRKNSEMERKLKEMETHQCLLRTEREALNAEKEKNEVAWSRQREELKDWENSLHEREERQLEGQRTLNQREEDINQKEKDLEEVQRKNEIIASTLKINEDDMLAKFAQKEKEAIAVEKNLKEKETELLALEEKLVARERIDIQKLYDEHNAILDLKRHEFELEMDQKRKIIDEKLKSREVLVELKEVQVFKKEDSNIKKERDLESKWKSLTEKEKSLEAEEKKLKMEKKDILSDREKLQRVTEELDKKKLDLDEKQLQLCNEKEKLQVIEEERREVQRLQSELRQEKDKCVLQEELLLKEQEAQKQERKNIEREWEVLDEKKAQITGLLNQVNEEKEKFENLKISNEDRLKNENLIAQDFIQKELEALRLKKASFEAHMERERLVLGEKTQTERHQMLIDFDLQKRELELDMQSKLEKKENDLLEKEGAIKEREQELNSINHSREEASKALKEMSLERLMIEKEIQEVASSKQYLEDLQIELQKDIDKLNSLVKKLKVQSKEFIEFLEKHDKCKNCGENINYFAPGDLKLLQEMGNREVVMFPSLSKGYTDGNTKVNRVGSETLAEATSGRPISWLLQCTSKVLNISPLTRTEDSVFQDEAAPQSEALLNFKDVAMPTPKIPLADIRKIEGPPDPSVNEHSGNIDQIAAPALEVPEVSVQSDSNCDPSKPGRKTKRGIGKTGSVKTVPEDSKLLIGKAEKAIKGEKPSGITDVSVGMSVASRGDSIGVDEGPAVVCNMDQIVAPAVEVSVQSESNCGPSKPDRKPRRGVGKTNSVKTIVEDSKVEGLPDPSVNEHRSTMDQIVAPASEVPEGSMQSESNCGPSKPGRKPRRGVGKTNSVKTIVEDSKVEGLPDPSVNEHRSTMDQIVAPTSEVPEVSMQSESNCGLSKPGRKPRCGVGKTNSVKTIVEDSKVEGLPDPSVNEHRSTMDQIVAPTSEVPEVSMQSESNCGPSKPGRKPRRGVGKTNSVKTIVEDSKVEGLPDPSVNEHSSNMDQIVALASEVPEVSVQSESYCGPIKPGRKPRRGGGRANSVNTVVEDSKFILGNAEKAIKGKKPSGMTDVSAGISVGSRGDSIGVNEGPAAVGRKQLHSYASNTTANEQDVNSTEATSVSVTASGSKKRKQTVSSGTQVPGEKRYNLRRR